MEPQTRTDPSQRKLRSYSGMANTWRKHALQSPTSDSRLSSLDIRGLPITTQKLTGLARVSPCLMPSQVSRMVYAGKNELRLKTALAHLSLMRRTRGINEAQSEGTNSLESKCAEVNARKISQKGL